MASLTQKCTRQMLWQTFTTERRVEPGTLSALATSFRTASEVWTVMVVALMSVRSCVLALTKGCFCHLGA